MIAVVIISFSVATFISGLTIGERNERRRFAQSSWMADATERQKQRFIAGLPVHPFEHEETGL